MGWEPSKIASSKIPSRIVLINRFKLLICICSKFEIPKLINCFGRDEYLQAYLTLVRVFRHEAMDWSSATRTPRTRWKMACPSRGVHCCRRTSTSCDDQVIKGFLHESVNRAVEFCSKLARWSCGVGQNREQNNEQNKGSFESLCVCVFLSLSPSFSVLGLAARVCC